MDPKRPKFRAHPSRMLPNARENSVCLREGNICTRERVVGQAHCSRHLTPTQAAECGYKRCNYISSRSGRRCNQYTSRKDMGKEGICMDHCRLITYIRRRADSKRKYKETPETIAETLSHYKKFSMNQSVMPTPDLNVPSTSGSQNKRVASTKMDRPKFDYFSDASSGDDEPTIGGPSNAQYNNAFIKSYAPPSRVMNFMDDFQVDLFDSNDPLRHAGVYTIDEIATQARDKLIRLRGLYADYFRVLTQKYRISRAKYLKRIRQENDRFGPVSKYPMKSYKDRKSYAQLRAMRRYGRKFGTAALLRQRSVCLRKRASGMTDVPDPDNEIFSMCQFLMGPNKMIQCKEDALPSAKFCIMHILHEPSQLLFAKCARPACQAAVPPLGSISHCWLHRPIPKLAPWEKEVELKTEDLNQSIADETKPPLSNEEKPSTSSPSVISSAPTNPAAADTIKNDIDKHLTSTSSSGGPQQQSYDKQEPPPVEIKSPSKLISDTIPKETPPTPIIEPPPLPPIPTVPPHPAATNTTQASKNLFTSNEQKNNTSSSSSNSDVELPSKKS